MPPARGPHIRDYSDAGGGLPNTANAGAAAARARNGQRDVKRRKWEAENPGQKLPAPGDPREAQFKRPADDGVTWSRDAFHA